jgi:transposase-like protein
MTEGQAIEAVKLHIGDPPFRGDRQIPAKSKLRIVRWIAAHPHVVATMFSTRIGLGAGVLWNWKCAAQNSRPIAVPKKEGPEPIVLVDLDIPTGRSLALCVRNIRAHIGKPPFRSHNRVPDESKLEIVRWARHRSGLSFPSAARRIGVALKTLTNWEQKALMSLADDAGTSATPPAKVARASKPDGPVLELGNGTRITGLSISEIVTVARAVTAESP